MKVGPIANIMVTSKQHIETEKIKIKSGKERNKTIGETTMVQELWKHSEKQIGGVIDVHVFDALYLNQYVMNLIKESEKYFVIRLKDEKRDIYKDSEGLFNNRCADIKNEIVETIIVRETKYTKEAKKKDKIKTIKEKVDITWNMLVRIFEESLHDDKSLKLLFNNTS